MKCLTVWESYAVSGPKTKIETNLKLKLGISQSYSGSQSGILIHTKADKFTCKMASPKPH